VAKPYLELRARRDTLYWLGENTNEARLGMNFGSSVQSFSWNMFLYQADRIDLKSEGTVQEFAALLTIGGELL
jgi:Na+/proline symporter